MVTIYLDAGHGGKDPGATYGNYLEKNWALDIDNRIAELIKVQNGLKLVGRTRTNDTFVDSTPRATKVKNSKAKYCISSHINAGGGQGAETLHSIYNNGKLAKEILKELGKIGLKTRSAKSRKGKNGDYYYMHRLTGSVTTIIVEYGFIDNATDRAFLNKAENRQKCAEAVVKAICNVEGIKYQAPAKKESAKEVGKLYRVQVGAFSNKDNADKLKKELEKKGYKPFIKQE